MYCSDDYFLIKKLFTGDLYANRGNIIGYWMEWANSQLLPPYGQGTKQ